MKIHGTDLVNDESKAMDGIWQEKQNTFFIKQRKDTIIQIISYRGREHY